MLEEQKYMLNQIVNQVDSHNPDVVVIAGDVYDKSVPPTDAVALLDDFLVRLSSRTKVFVISGNHDSAERLAFGASLMNHSGVFISPAYNGGVSPKTLHDEFGEVDFYPLPFVRPSTVRNFFPDEEINDFTDAVRVAVGKMNIDKAKRNVVIAHQFVTADGVQIERSDSETVAVGGLDNVDASVFDDFDYVALGHIHGPQSVGKNTIRYCGSPLKYSFSEAPQKKGILMVEMGRKGNVETTSVPLVPLHEMRTVKGFFDDLIRQTSTDFVKIILFDDFVPDAMSRLRDKYPNIMEMSFERNAGSQANIGKTSDVKKSPFEMFEEFFVRRSGGKEMDEKQKEFVNQLIRKIWGE